MKFSVSMSVYKNDRGEWFRQALLSILNQTRPPDEIVMVVDGPIGNDISDEIADFSTKHNGLLKTVRLANNLGHGNARRIGLQNCSHDLVALMDSDDVSVPQRFALQIECFEKDPDLSLAGGQICEFVDSTDKIVGVRKVPLSDAEIREYVKVRCPFNQTTVMFKKSEVIRAGGYLDWYCNEDYYLWIRMCLAGCKFLNLSENLVFARVGKETYNRRGGWRYFRSEAGLQKFMLIRGLISRSRFFVNVMIRLAVQIILPDHLRGLIFQKLFRERALQNEKV